jgi:uncharacterized protein (TIGR02186 family)
MRRPLALLFLTIALLPAVAQDARTPRMGPPRPVQQPAPQSPALIAPTAPRATVEADISTRTFEITTGFAGHEIIVFGAVDNSQAPAEQTDYYDVVVVVEGTPFPVVVRKKSDVAGVWINTSSITFASVPSYYAITSTKPIEQIAGPAVLERHAIGFRHIAMRPSPGYRGAIKDYELAAFRAAVIRLKKQQNLYVTEPNGGVTFTGRSLFRSTIALPANVPVGPLVARTYLFRNGEVVSAHIARVTLQRAGIERLVHNFAFIYPMSYGLIAVLLAVVSGLLASAYFRRQPG